MAVLYRYPMEGLTPEKEHPLYSESVLEGIEGEHFRSALSSFEKKHYQEAEIKFTMLLEQYPEGELAGVATFFLADLFLQMAGDSNDERLKKALETYERAVRQYRDSPNAPQGLVKIGQIYMRLGFFYEARAYLQRVIDLYPQHPYAAMAQLEIARNAYLHRRYAEALEEYEKVMRGYPRSPEWKAALFGKANSLYHLKRYREAQSAYEESLSKIPSYLKSDPQTLWNMGQTYLLNGRFSEARTAFFTLVSLYPQDPQAGLALIRLGDTYRLEGDHDKARKVYTDMDSIHVENEATRLGRLALAALEVEASEASGTKVIFTGDPLERAARISQEALQDSQAGPLVQEGILRIGDVFHKVHRVQEAIDLYWQFLAQYPDTPWRKSAIRGLGRALQVDFENQYGEGQYLKVVEAFERSRPFISETSIPTHQLLQVADSYLRVGLLSEAITLYQAAKGDLGEEDLYRLAQAYIQQSDDRMVIKTLDQFLVRYPKSPKRPEALRALGDSLSRVGRSERAVALYRDWLEKYGQDPAVPQVRFRLAQAYQALKKFSQAVKEYRALINQLQKVERKEDEALRSQAYLRMGDSLYLDRQYREALTVYQAVLKTGLQGEEADWVRYQVGNCFLRLHQLDNAISVFSELSDQSRDELLKRITSEKARRINFADQNTRR